MPEAAPAPCFLQHLDHLEISAEQPEDVLSREVPPVSSLGNMPRSAASLKEAKSGAKNGKHVESAHLEDSQDVGPVSRPGELPLVMQAPVVQHHVKACLWKRQVKGVPLEEGYPLRPARRSREPSAFRVPHSEFRVVFPPEQTANPIPLDQYSGRFHSNYFVSSIQLRLDDE